MATLVNNMPYPDGIDFSTKPLEQVNPYQDQSYLNSSNEHMHNLFSSSGQNVKNNIAQNGQNLWESRDDLRLSGGYNFGSFWDYNNFDILKWGRFLNPGFASYL
jgi:hypothetical protein